MSKFITIATTQYGETLGPTCADSVSQRMAYTYEMKSHTVGMLQTFCRVRVVCCWGRIPASTPLSWAWDDMYNKPNLAQFHQSEISSMSL